MATTEKLADKAKRSNDARLVGRQLYYEQLSFWKNPFGSVFTVVFSLVFLVLLAAAGRDQKLAVLGGKPEIQYLVPGFAAYGVMAACFNLLAISLVNRRETGLLKRLRLSPLPTWMMLAALLLSSLIISAVQVVLLLGVGKFAFHVQLPQNVVAFLLAFIVGVICFTALGIAASTVVPNQDAAGPMVSIVFFVLLFLSGLWYPLTPGSTLYKIANWFPVYHLIQAMFRPFDLIPGQSPWAWGDLKWIAIWGVGGVIVALRRFRWEPRKS
ncbi:MAG: ABC transporter permease [Acidimicrobiales bacterium]